MHPPMPPLRSLLFLALAPLVFAEACSGSGQAGDNSSTSGGTALQKNSGDCDTDADCAGAKCAEVTPSGFRVCAPPVLEAMGCKSPLDRCCSTDDCLGGTKCFAKLAYCETQGQYYNVCQGDECQTDKDCEFDGSGKICVPAGVLKNGASFCMDFRCTTDSNCREEAGGKCAPIFDGRLGTYISLACIYPSDGCRSEADCLAAQSCAIQGARARCLNGAFDCVP